MSQTRITLPITVAEINSSPVHIKAVSDWEAVTNPDTARFRFTHSNENPHGPFNPWQLRDDFLNWSLEDWSGFFYMAGTFGGVYITRNDFEEWQRLMRKALVLPSCEWKTLASEFDSKKVAKLSASLPIIFDWDTEPPTARLLGLTSLGTLIATIQLDKVQGAEFRICALDDCEKPPFRVGVHQKLYCNPKCAHLAAVRAARTRARANPVKRKTQSKTSQRKDSK